MAFKSNFIRKSSSSSPRTPRSTTPSTHHKPHPQHRHATPHPPRLRALPSDEKGLGDVDTKSVDELSALELRTLQKALEAVINRQDFNTAVKLRDAIKMAEMRDPIRSLEIELQDAIRAERYGDAALLRDQLNERQKKALLRMLREGPEGFEAA